LPVEWKKSIIVPICKAEKKECSNYRSISLLSTTYKILTIVLLSWLTQYRGNHLGSSVWILTQQVSYSLYIFCIHQILEKKWEYNKAVHQLFIDFKKAYNSVRREVLYNILIQSDIPRKLVNLIKMGLNETYNSVCVGKHLSHVSY
jgi:hypothetical protein